MITFSGASAKNLHLGSSLRPQASSIIFYCNSTLQNANLTWFWNLNVRTLTCMLSPLIQYLGWVLPIGPKQNISVSKIILNYVAWANCMHCVWVWPILHAGSTYPIAAISPPIAFSVTPAFQLMHSRKHHAHKPVLSTRNPKQPRPPLEGYSDGAASPSETEIRSRWLAFTKQYTVLIADAVMPPCKIGFIWLFKLDFSIWIAV